MSSQSLFKRWRSGADRTDSDLKILFSEDLINVYISQIFEYFDIYFSGAFKVNQNISVHCELSKVNPITLQTIRQKYK